MTTAPHPAITPTAHPAMATVTETTMPPIHTMLLHITIPTIIAVPHHIPMSDTPPRTMAAMPPIHTMLLHTTTLTIR